MFRSRVVLAIIGVILVGGISTGAAMLSGANPGSLINTIAARATATATASTAATATSSSTPDTTNSPAATATAPGAAPTQAPSGQVIDLHGTITDIGSSQFTLRDASGTNWTVQVTSNTAYDGAAKTFSGLRERMVAEVKGVITAGTTFRAYLVNSDTGA